MNFKVDYGVVEIFIWKWNVFGIVLDILDVIFYGGVFYFMKIGLDYGVIDIIYGNMVWIFDCLGG